MAASSPARGAFALAGRLRQCGQQVSEVIPARVRDSTAVKVISPGDRPAVAAARAASRDQVFKPGRRERVGVVPRSV
jgi:hypothetical protein